MVLLPSIAFTRFLSLVGKIPTRVGLWLVVVLHSRCIPGVFAFPVHSRCMPGACSDAGLLLVVWLVARCGFAGVPLACCWWSAAVLLGRIFQHGLLPDAIVRQMMRPLSRTLDRLLDGKLDGLVDGLVDGLLMVS